MKHYTFEDINDRTGFANGEQFKNSRQVRSYFTVNALAGCLGKGTPEANMLPAQSELNDMAKMVIVHHWHMA